MEDGSDGRSDRDIAVIEARGVRKHFGSIEALSHVDFEVRPGEIAGLLGDNGAGKSTFIKVLNGYHRPDGGELRWHGVPVEIASPKVAQRLGISVAYQDLAIVDLMSIYRNLFLGREDESEVSARLGPLRFFRPVFARREADRVLREIGINVRDTRELVANLSGGERQSIAIARAVHFSARLLIMDEPTSQLSLKETDKVLGYMDEARKRGVAVIFISHNVKHVSTIADRFTILWRGRSVAAFERGRYSDDEIGEIIVRGPEADALVGERS